MTGMCCSWRDWCGRGESGRIMSDKRVELWTYSTVPIDWSIGGKYGGGFLVVAVARDGTAATNR